MLIVNNVFFITVFLSFLEPTFATSTTPVSISTFTAFERLASACATSNQAQVYGGQSAGGIPPLGTEGDRRQARGLVNSFFFLFHLFAIILLVIRYKNNPYAQLVTCAGFMKKYNRKFLPVNASANGGGGENQ